jgi:hypothetical protein
MGVASKKETGAARTRFNSISCNTCKVFFKKNTKLERTRRNRPRTKTRTRTKKETRRTRRSSRPRPRPRRKRTTRRRRRREGRSSRGRRMGRLCMTHVGGCDASISEEESTRDGKEGISHR